MDTMRKSMRLLMTVACGVLALSLVAGCGGKKEVKTEDMTKSVAPPPGGSAGAAATKTEVPNTVSNN
ncbi:MAG: hypothetical protein IT204_10675 [Fimbriimonadaceae bacterium]|nr:hypothetical protein [Fimbriimonadaceae bacterium]